MVPNGSSTVYLALTTPQSLIPLDHFDLKTASLFICLAIDFWHFSSPVFPRI